MCETNAQQQLRHDPACSQHHGLSQDVQPCFDKLNPCINKLSVAVFAQQVNCKTGKNPVSMYHIWRGALLMMCDWAPDVSPEANWEPPCRKQTTVETQCVGSLFLHLSTFVYYSTIPFSQNQQSEARAVVSHIMVPESCCRPPGEPSRSPCWILGTKQHTCWCPHHPACSRSWPCAKQKLSTKFMPLCVAVWGWVSSSKYGLEFVCSWGFVNCGFDM